MNDERTIYDAELTENKPQQTQQEIQNASTEKKEEVTNNRVPNKRPMWKRAAMGAGAGIIAGGATAILTSGTTQEQAQQQESTDINGNGENGNHPAWTDGEVPVASSVNDNMSFTEAFNAARAEVGAGGAFEWHGNIYNTYYEDEWAGMTAAERREFGKHFSWNEQHNDVANNHQATEMSNDEVTANIVDPSDGDEAIVNVVETPIESGDVEILGVVHDDASGANIGGMMIDGHEAVMIDVNGDMTFNILGVDANDNHEYEENEQYDISEYGITVDQFNQQAGVSSEQAALNTEIEDSVVYEG